MLSKMYATSKGFVTNFLPSSKKTFKTYADLLPDLQDCPKEELERLRSVARGGAKSALGLVMAHHPEIKIWRVTKCMPTKDYDSKKNIPEEIYKVCCRLCVACCGHGRLEHFLLQKALPPRPSVPQTTNSPSKRRTTTKSLNEKTKLKANLKLKPMPASFLPSPLHKVGRHLHYRAFWAENRLYGL